MGVRMSEGNELQTAGPERGERGLQGDDGLGAVAPTVVAEQDVTRTGGKQFGGDV
jgi:hypothetical protein